MDKAKDKLELALIQIPQLAEGETKDLLVKQRVLSHALTGFERINKRRDPQRPLELFSEAKRAFTFKTETETGLKLEKLDQNKAGWRTTCKHEQSSAMMRQQTISRVCIWEKKRFRSLFAIKDIFYERDSTSTISVPVHTVQISNCSGKKTAHFEVVMVLMSQP